MTTFDMRALPPPPHNLLMQASLFLDLDGTLIEIAERPDAVTIDPALIHLLARLHAALAGRLIIVSGRPAAEVRALLGSTFLSVAGSHGAELLDAGGPDETPPPMEPPKDVLARLQLLAAEHPGVLIEAKPFGLALHYRMAPQAARACREAAEEVAAEQGYVLQAGKMVIELKYLSTSKGDAVRAFMGRKLMRGSTPLFMGDDLTDEAGFAAANALRGAGILIGPPRPTRANYALPDVASALCWLKLAAALLS